MNMNTWNNTANNPETGARTFSNGRGDTITLYYGDYPNEAALHAALSRKVQNGQFDRKEDDGQ